MNASIIASWPLREQRGLRPFLAFTTFIAFVTHFHAFVALESPL